jgi:hypothetical protein
VRDKIEWLIDNAEPIEHHRLDRCPRGHNPHFRVLLSRLINDVAKAEFIKHDCHESQMIQGFTPVAGWHRVLLPGGDFTE